MRAKRSFSILLAMMLMLFALFSGQAALAQTTNQPSQTIGTAEQNQNSAVPAQRPDTPAPTSGASAAVEPAAETTADVSEQLGFFVRQYGLMLLVALATIALLVLIVLLIRSGKRNAPSETTAQTELNEIASTDEKNRPLPPPALHQVGNVHHVGQRSYQQDAFGVSSLQDAALRQSKGVLAVLADGMGGMVGSGEISQAAVAAALNSFPHTPGDTRETLATLAANILNMAQKRFAGSGAGSTLILANIRGNRLDYITIGDSRIALWRSGALLTLNREHNYAATLHHQAALGIIPWQQAAENPRRRALTSYLGIETDPAMDFPAEPIRLLSGDKIVLMSDGVFGTLDDETLAQLLNKEAAEAAEAIEAAVLAQGKASQDNFTALILEIQ